MRKLAILVLGFLLLFAAVLPLATVSLAAESGAHDDHGDQDVIGGPNAGIWKTVNFIALAGIIAYMLRGKVTPFFDAHKLQIASGMSSAAAREKEAQQRLQSVEARIAGLETEIAQLRESAHQEMDRDRQRVEAETAQALARIQQHTTREIATAGAVARTQLRQHAASLAMELAVKQVNARAAEPGMQDLLLAQALERLSQTDSASKN